MISNPTPQRALRGHRPTKSTPRPRNSADHRAWLAQHLTARDRWLIRMLYEHKVLTSHQIIDLAFPSRRAANLRLRSLYTWGVVHRFQPYLTLGSAPMHYVLDVTGATILADEEGIDLSSLNYSRDRATGRAQSLQLAHDVGCNSLFTSLIHHARQPGATGLLTVWWSAARCRRLWGDIVTPDGYGRWQQASREIEWFVEFDFGTEQLSRLTDKIDRYAQLTLSTGVMAPVLFWFPTSQREASARNAFHAMEHPDRVPVATTHAATIGMAGARWLAVGSAHSLGRVTLADLPTLWPGIPASVAPADTGSTLTAPCPMPPPAADYERARRAS